MTIDGFELANKLAILNAGRNPEWNLMSGYTGAPDAVDDGQWLKEATRALVRVGVRENAALRSADVTITGVDAAQTYTVGIVDPATGLTHNTTGTGVDADAIITDLVANLAGVAATLVTFTPEDLSGDGNYDNLLIQGLAEASYGIEVGTTGGTATIRCDADADTATARIFVTADGQVYGTTAPPVGWEMVLNGEYGLDYRGMFARFETGGLRRMYVEITGIGGNANDLANANGTIAYDVADVYIAPCIEE